MDTVALRSKFVDMKSRTDAMVATVAEAEGYARVAWEKRCSAGHCVHNDYFHITQGWSPGTPSAQFVNSHYRTRDWVVAERAMAGPNMPPCVMNEMISFNGLLYRGSGLDTLPVIANDDLCTNAVYSSPNGCAPWTPEANIPFDARECYGFLATNDGPLIWNGERYTGVQPPQAAYVMHQDAWLRGASGTWALRSSALPKRRNFAHVLWNGSIFMLAGADDMHNGANYRHVYAEILKSSDGMQTVTSLGDGPFGPRYGVRAAKAWGHVILIGGAYGDGGFSDQVAFTNRCWASNHPDLIPSSWFEIAPLPQALNHAMAGTLTVNGVETVGVIGGYNNLTHAGGGPLGTIYTLDGIGSQWRSRTDSDFWVE